MILYFMFLRAVLIDPDACGLGLSPGEPVFREYLEHFSGFR